MAIYRLYFMDLFTGSIRNCTDFEATSDDEARDYCECHVGEERLELWSGKLRLQQYPSVDSDPPRSRRKLSLVLR